MSDKRFVIQNFLDNAEACCKTHWTCLWVESTKQYLINQKKIDLLTLTRDSLSHLVKFLFSPIFLETELTVKDVHKIQFPAQ